MGLDLVELVMAIEEEFGVEIPDDFQLPEPTVGALYELLLSTTAQPRPPEDRLHACPEWRRLQSLVAEQAGLRPADVRPDSRFVEDLGLSI